MMSSLSASASSNPTDADYVLGQTGDTVVYIFPTGHALMNRDAANVGTALVKHQPQPAQPAQPDPSPAQSFSDEAARIDSLLAQGKLTVAQIQVARYDQSVTGMSLTEALTLRGWL
jgi:hypothetical protein